MNDPLEKVVRPIVEGQIRGFLKEHPVIVEAVDWFKPRKDKSVTFTNSLAKRIVRDLVCEVNRNRIEDALFEVWEKEKSGVELFAAPDGLVAETLTWRPPLNGSEMAIGAVGVRPGTSAGPDAYFDDWFGN